MTANLTPIIWTVWAILALVTAILYAYRTSLTRDEDGQIFLDEAFDHEKAAQAQIVAKVNRIEPLVRLCLILTVIMTVAVIGYYGWGATRLIFE
jgi:hypothetical protein